MWRDRRRNLLPRSPTWNEYAPKISLEQYAVEVIDLKKNPKLAREHSIVAIPTLVRELPVPMRKLIGDLSDTHKVLVNLKISDGV